MMTTTSNQVVVSLDSQLRQTSGLLKKREREILAQFAVTPPQFEALLTLKEYGNLTMGELCSRLFLACSTATDLIDRMERNGLVRRVRDLTDRRAVRLEVLQKGHDVAAEVMAARQVQLAEVLAPVSLEDKERLIQSLEQLQYYLLRETGA